MKIAIVGHISRLPRCERLSQLFGAEVFIDSVGKGALFNHLRALRWASQQSERVIVMEDDAIPVVGFEEKAERWFSLFPDYFLSFYLGTSRPPQYQSIIDKLIPEAQLLERDYIVLQQLIHGVCYSPPVGSIPKILGKIDMSKPADFAIGSAWGNGVFYSIKSLVEHADEPSVEKHTDGRVSSGKRVARFLDGGLSNV